MKGKKSTAGVSLNDDSPPEKSVANGDSTDTTSTDETIVMHQRLQHKRLQKGKQPMKENHAQDEEMCVHNREIDQNEEDQEEDGGGGEEAEEMEEEEEGADDQRLKLPDGFYPVEAIRKKRKLRGVTQYFIKWRDWPETDNTWEPIENLEECPDLIEAFEESSQSAKRRSGRRGKRRHGVTPTQSKKKRQEQQLVENSLPSAAVMDASNAIEAQTGPMMDSLNSVETEAAALVDSSNPVDEKLEKSDDVSEHVQVIPLDDEGRNEMNLSTTKINEHNSSRSENEDKLDNVSVDVQETAAPESVALVNEVASEDGQDASQSGLDPDNAEFPLTKLIKVMEYSASASDTTQVVAVSFLAMRSDGKEVVVTNKDLRANYPLLLIDFYEQHSRSRAPE